MEIASLDAGALDVREAKSFELDMLRRNLEGRGVIHERRIARLAVKMSVDLLPGHLGSDRHGGPEQGIDVGSTQTGADPRCIPGERPAAT